MAGPVGDLDWPVPPRPSDGTMRRYTSERRPHGRGLPAPCHVLPRAAAPAIMRLNGCPPAHRRSAWAVGAWSRTGRLQNLIEHWAAAVGHPGQPNPGNYTNHIDQRGCTV